MTLIIGAADQTSAVLAVDRRVSRDGVFVDDETTKLTVLFTVDARVGIAFTGLARRGNFVVEDWLPDKIRELAGSTGSIYELLPRLKTEVTEAVAQADPKGNIAIAVLGFAYDSNSNPSPVGWTIACGPHSAEIFSHGGPPVKISLGDVNSRVATALRALSSCA